MPTAPAWKIRYYVSVDGTKPFKDFIKRLEARKERAECSALIKFLRMRGAALDGHRHFTHTKGLRFGLHLHEVSDKSVRIFYVCDGDAVVIIDGLFPEQGKEFFKEICRKAEDYLSHE